MLALYKQFINASIKGTRLQKNGTRIRRGTIRNYEFALRLLEKFSTEENFELRILPTPKLRKSEFNAEKQYWKSFYAKFTTYMFANKLHDNYVGTVIKNIKVFFNYIESEKNISISQLHKHFYVLKSEPPIFTLDAAQLQFLIHDTEFEIQLDDLQKKVKDVFVFGATVALRISDLMNLKQSNLIQYNGSSYIRTHSLKTNTFTQVKLPLYALKILEKYKGCRGQYLLPSFYLNTFNDHLKEIDELAQWQFSVEKRHFRRGVLVNVTSSKKRFCDIMSSHMMRKTAITNMLVHRVDENIVRKISGHAPGSREFYRYVSYHQTLIDEKTDQYFEALSQFEKPQKMQENDCF